MLDRLKKQKPGGNSGNDEDSEFVDLTDKLPDAEGALALIDRAVSDTGIEQARKERSLRKLQRRKTDEHTFCCNCC